MNFTCFLDAHSVQAGFSVKLLRLKLLFGYGDVHYELVKRYIYEFRSFEEVVLITIEAYISCKFRLQFQTLFF